LRERWPGAVGIVLTGFGSVEAAVQAIRAGADDFLLKPSDVAELKASIARAMHWRAQMDRRSAALERVKARLVAELAERWQREDRLRQSEAQLALAQAHFGIWEWDVRDNLMVWSDELYRIFGFLPHEFDAAFETFLQRVHADDRELVRRAIETAGGQARHSSSITGSCARTARSASCTRAGRRLRTRRDGPCGCSAQRKMPPSARKPKHASVCWRASTASRKSSSPLPATISRVH
jgi:YesN/AraC family two-component response regulator